MKINTKFLFYSSSDSFCLIASHILVFGQLLCFFENKCGPFEKWVAYNQNWYIMACQFGSQSHKLSEIVGMSINRDTNVSAFFWITNLILKTWENTKFTLRYLIVSQFHSVFKLLSMIVESFKTYFWGHAFWYFLNLKKGHGPKNLVCNFLLRTCDNIFIINNIF